MILKQISITLQLITKHFSIKQLLKFYCVLLSFLIFDPLFCQQVDFCGSLPFHQANSQHPDSICFDRFGNSYDLYSTGAGLINSVQMTPGYFSIDYAGPPEYLPTINQVFEDLSALIPRKNNTKSCGGLIGQEEVRIRIRATTNASYLMAASPMWIPYSYKKCSELNVNELNLIINSGKGKSENGFDGMINFNALISWHVDYQTPPPIGSGKFDFRSALIHEILHLYGFAGLINNLGGPDANIGYDIWDNYLYRYDLTGGQGTKVIIGNCQTNCWALNPAIQNFESIVTNNCAPGSSYIIGIGNPYLAPVNGANGYGNGVSFENYLSHLHPNCLNSNPNYIMQSFLAPEQRRVIVTTEELSILCKLGYNTSSCQGCHLGAYKEFHIENVNEIECCSKIYAACKGETIVVPISDLLCNDASGSTIALTDIFYPPFNGLSHSIVNNNIEITGSREGTFSINYTLTSCDCKQQNASFTIIITQCLECASRNPCLNLTCTDGFEEFAITGSPYSLTYALSGVAWVFNNFYQNTPDLCINNFNKYLQIYSSSSYIEGIIFKLQEGIPPNCTIHLNLQGATSQGSTGLVVLGSSNPPCDILSSKTNLGCSGNLCNYDPSCLDEIEIDNVVVSQNTYCPNNFSFNSYSLDIENLTGKTINYIVLYPRDDNNRVYQLYLDNIVVTKDCIPPIDFTFTIDGCDVSYIGSPDLSGINYSWNFGDATTGNGRILNHTYLISGTYNVILTIEDQCGNTKSVQHNVTVNCIPPPNCNCQNNCIQIGDNGTTTKVNNNGTILPNFFFGCYNICGTLDVNQNFNISIATLNMGPGSKIIVRSGATLNIALSDLQGCNSMWQGIILEQGAHISLVLATISDAEYAVDCLGNVAFDYCIGSIFRNNYVGIHAPAGGFKNIASPIFSGNLFDFYAWKPFFPGQSPLPQTRTFAGIEINNALMLLTSGTNNFLNLQNGIVCRSGGIVAEDCIMTNMIPESPFQGDQHCYPSFTNADGFGLYSNFAFIRANNNIISNAFGGIVNVRSFTSCYDNNISNIKYGIYSLNAIFGPVTATNNIINQFVHYGIRVISPTIGIRPVITDNQITAVGTGEAGANDCAGVCIDLEDVQSDGIGQIENNNPLLAPFALGIRMSNCSNIGVQSNFIQNSVEGIVNQTCRRCGIYSNECQGLNLMESIRSFSQNSSTSITYCCNTSNNSGFGFDFSGQNNPTPLFGNNIHSHITGLQIDESAVIGDQFDRGNRWLNTALNGGHNAVNLNPIPDVRNLSQFFITPCTNNFWPMPMSIFPSQPHCVGGTTEWFVISDNLSNACPINSCIPIVFPIPPYDDGGIPITTDYYNDSLITISDLNEVLGWEEKRDLMYRLVANPNLLGQNSIIDAFYNSSQNLGLKNFAINEISIINARNLSGTGKISLNSNLLSFENLLNEWRDLDSHYISSGDTLSVNSLKAVKQVSMFNIMINTFALITQELLENETQLDQLIEENLSLEDNLIYKENEIVVNDVFLSTVARGIYSFTNEQVNDLYGISIQCPNTGGRAVLMARKIYNYYNPTYFDDDIVCNSQPIVLNNNGVDGEINKFKIFPNPTNKLLNIIPNNSLGSQKYEIRINAIGMSNIISNKMDVIKKGNSYEMDISTLVNGIYFISIWNNGYNIYNSKFVKID